MINFGTGFIVHELDWEFFKEIVLKKQLSIQHAFEITPSTPEGYYVVYSIDEKIVYKTIIYNGTIPSICDFTQEVNDQNKADFISNFISSSNKRLGPMLQGNDSALKVSPVGRNGSEVVWATHNFCDKTTWYANSIRKTEIVLTSSDGYTFYENNSQESWIDLYNGKVLHEDNIRAAANGYFDISVTVDSEQKTMIDCPVHTCSYCVGDYTVNFTSGSITFNTQITGSVKASFCVPTDAWWVLKPQPNTRLSVEGAEMQFSEDVDLKDNIVMQIRGYVQVFAPQYWQGNGGPFPTNHKIVLGEYQYKSLAEFVDETEGAYPVVPAIGGQERGLKSAMYGMPFAYKTIRELYDAYGMEIRVGLKHNHQFGGFRATATFYCVEKT